MFLERTGESSQSFEWKWAGTRCDQQKSYICQYGESPLHTQSRETESACVCVKERERDELNCIVRTID